MFLDSKFSLLTWQEDLQVFNSTDLDRRTNNDVTRPICPSGRNGRRNDNGVIWIISNAILFCMQRVKVSIIFFDQQFRSQTRDDRSVLQAALAGRIVFQVDQATFAYQDLSGNQRECREDANMDRGLYLRTHRYRQKTSAFASQPLRNSTNPESHHV